MRHRWLRFLSMPDRERARVLAVIMGCIVIGMLYALGGLSLYLRARFLGTSATPLSAVGRPTQAPTSAQAQPPVATMALSTPTLAPTATLYPTITPNLTATHLAAGETRVAPTSAPGTAMPMPLPSATETPTEPPTTTPTAAPTLTLAPTETPSPLPTKTTILVLRPTRANQ